MRITTNFDIICFDCDSTLSRIEGIDECAKRVGLGQKMAQLTDAAMNGDLRLEEVYKQRLELIRPSQTAIATVADLYISQKVAGVVEVFKTLRHHHKQIHIISGGLRQAILPLAHLLDVPEDHVHAVNILFNQDGSYQDFDQQSPLTRTGGKAQICQTISHNFEKMILIGDGKTDLEVQPLGVKVIGFGGVVKRDLVVQQADFYITDPSLTAILNIIL